MFTYRIHSYEEFITVRVIVSIWEHFSDCRAYAFLNTLFLIPCVPGNRACPFVFTELCFQN